jgi:AcrR family transcriptional regulator
MNVKKQQAELTKKELLAAAYKIIREEGILKLSANRIAAVANVSKGGFFHHFPHMEDLYLYLLDSLIQQFDEDINPNQYTDIREYMNISTEYMFSVLDHSPEIITTLFYFLSQSQRNLKYQQRLKTMLEGTFVNWAKKLSHFFSPPLTEFEMDTIVRIVDIYFGGFSLHYQVFQDKARYRKLSHDFTTMILTFVENRSNFETSS